MFGSASQGGKQADRLYIGMSASLIAFLGSAAEYLRLSAMFVDNERVFIYNSYKLRI